MKTILGLDLGTTSIGWALVKEAETSEEKSSIVKLGVRVNPLTVDEQTNFSKGRPITTNADRTLKRSARRNLQRYKLRRDNLIEVLKEAGLILDDAVLAEHGAGSTFETLGLRAKAAGEKVSLEELARILLMLNKKRGYKSSRKAKNDADGQAIDGMSIAKELYEKDLTPGQYVYQSLSAGKKYIPDFYRSDLQAEFDKVWNCQKAFYNELLTDALKSELEGKNEKQTWAICEKYFGIAGINRTTKGDELKKENYLWRAKAVEEQMDLESLAVVFQKINSQINGSSGYLGAISDRSKELYFNNLTVGQYLAQKVSEDSHFSLKNIVFYRQDYMDEFERIWSVQAKYHPELTDDLKKQIRDIVIFYQRPLKSQKGLVSICELEGREIEVTCEGKTKKKLVGPRVCPKSSPLFQEFKIWQVLNNLTANKRCLSQDEKERLYDRLCTCDKLSKSEIIKCLNPEKSARERRQDSLFAPEEMYEDEVLVRLENKKKEIVLNYKEIDGNKTMAALFRAYAKIIMLTGHDEYDFSKMPFSKAAGIISDIFAGLGYKTDFLHFDSSLEGKAFEEQASYRLWHLLYSYEGDKSVSGNERLISKISELTGLEPEYAKVLANVTFAPDYGSLSTKAMKRILTFMKEGNEYSLACMYAGYNHSKNSLTKEQIETKMLKEHLEILPKNSLRNPVVEKILNQMANVVNAVIDEYGRPDEIRIELARELKKSAAEREELSRAVASADKQHTKIRETLQKEFGIANPSRNDVIRYRLYEELKDNGYKTLYSGTYISPEKIFSKDFDIEHIIPQSRLFDDSFSNKTLEARQVNLDKGNATAYDYVKDKYGEAEVEKYVARVEQLYKAGGISKAKRNKLLMQMADIPSDFIARDLRDSQYIARKAKSMLEEIARHVVSTTGSVTDRLREDWQLVDVMKELNWNKYDRLGLTEIVQDHDGRRIKKIRDWTKRNDHRHHAMDALTIAFTKLSYIQYLNNLNARIRKEAGKEYMADLAQYSVLDIPKSDRADVVMAIERTQLYRDKFGGRLRFMPPIPLDEFRREARRHLENTLVSIKAKNKVVTRNVNSTKCKGGTNKKVQLTPRGQLHNETVYGKIRRYAVKSEKVGATFTFEKIAKVASPVYRTALMERLKQFGGDSKKAFSGKNSIDKSPVYVDAMHTRPVPEKVSLLSMEEMFTVRKPVTPDLKVDKVVDEGIRRILQARLDEYGGDPKKAFSDLDGNPIWLNKDKGIQVKSVKIKGINNAVALHDKCDHYGRSVMNADGVRIPTDYVSPGNNHHVAIFRDADGNLQEQVVSFYDAVARVSLGMPVIDREYKKDEGWEFLFTMKQNEYFVFPNPETGFDPNEYDLLNPDNYAVISPNLFRVQKLASKYYVFRHHLETNVEEKKELQEIAWKRISTPNNLRNIVKVRINHIGQIVQVGEY
ncbi:MAG: type II CRISPR RNA-guided endonuclease Cas9 [Bacteroidales bacterium]|nr:type II CRISPR RNA-guided endonuclease Cas9 [Bacteroidales bacterium]